MRQLIICKSFWKCIVHIGNYMYYNLISYKCGLLIIVFIKENQKTKRKCIWTFYTKNIFYSISLTFRDELGEKSSILLRLDFFLITNSQWNGMAHALMYIKTWAYCIHEIVLTMKDYTLPWPPHSQPHNISAFNIWALWLNYNIWALCSILQYLGLM